MEIQKSQKGGGLSQNGSMKTHQHVYHKTESYSMVVNHQFWAEAPLKRPEDNGSLPHQDEAPQKRGLVSLVDKETSHIC